MIRWPWWAETLLVGVVCALSVQDATAVADGTYAGVPVAVALVSGLSVALRYRWPVAVTAVAVAAAGGWGLVLPLLVALFHLSARGRVKEAAGAVVAALALNTVVEPVLNLWAPRAYGPSLLLLLAVALGLWAGGRRRLVESLATQVEQLRTERELREQAARLAERATIAAEMHDVLAHRLSLIALHAGVLATRKVSLPARVAERLDLLRTTSTDALADLRDVLGALRDPDADVVGAPPAPALREVDELIEQARHAGQSIEVTVTGRAGRVAAAHRLAVYRLVQEALTNARKHAPGTAVSVRVNYGPPATIVEVINPAATRPATVTPSGFGLIGLRERVEALGGHLNAGPSGGGAWRLAARIPHTPTDTIRTHRTAPPA
ncbi:sensor histidine kinase [Streptomyces sp. AP-93]|uniref:sensor histidine kinase n=1 Tax=Streptomyces sp. AP-93 TaxID=2929048 RepID=UPI001FAF98B9|nr:histidine kinase [Streptomyces sp. AP-93]MCJ0872598.1 histidine kinase [Streptomyces sp. AP-93]